MSVASGDREGFSFDLQLPPDTTAIVNLRIILRELTKGELGMRIAIWQANVADCRKQAPTAFLAQAEHDDDAADLRFDLVLPSIASE